MISKFALMKSTTGMVAAASIGMGMLASTQPARAGSDDVVRGIIGLAIICGVTDCLNDGKSKTKKAGSKARGPRVASDVSLTTSDQRKDIQMVLADKGYYSSTIDGSFGKGTRAAIRNWQSDRGYAANGVLSAEQISELLSASPRYASLPVDDPMRLEIAVADELDRDSLLLLQAELNALGYDAGTPDGVMGRRTRAAITAYKADRGIGGKPVASRLLLAHLTEDFGDERLAIVDGDAPSAVGEESVSYQGVAGAEAGIVPADEVAPTEVASLETFQFDILSLQTGMSRDEVEGKLAEHLPADAMIDFGRGEQINGKGALNLGHRMYSASWPEVSTEEIVTLYDNDDLIAGAIAVLRSVRLPEAVGLDDYKRETVPSLKSAYGTDALVHEGADGTLVWVGDADARNAIVGGTMAHTDCGEVALTQSADVGLWEDGAGPKLADDLAAAIAPCGNVLSVSFVDGVLEFNLWDSDVLADADMKPVIEDASVEKVVPEIKF